MGNALIILVVTNNFSGGNKKPGEMGQYSNPVKGSGAKKKRQRNDNREPNSRMKLSVGFV